MNEECCNHPSSILKYIFKKLTILPHGKALKTSMGLPKIDWLAVVILANWNGLRVIIEVTYQ